MRDHGTKLKQLLKHWSTEKLCMSNSWHKHSVVLAYSMLPNATIDNAWRGFEQKGAWFHIHPKSSIHIRMSILLSVEFNIKAKVYVYTYLCSWHHFVASKHNSWRSKRNSDGDNQLNIKRVN